jgi:hypothetical protein
MGVPPSCHTSFFIFSQNTTRQGIGRQACSLRVLDRVVETMQSGADMHEKYRKTSRGGLAMVLPNADTKRYPVLRSPNVSGGTLYAAATAKWSIEGIQLYGRRSAALNAADRQLG